MRTLRTVPASRERIYFRHYRTLFVLDGVRRTYPNLSTRMIDRFLIRSVASYAKKG